MTTPGGRLGTVMGEVGGQVVVSYEKPRRLVGERTRRVSILSAGAHDAKDIEPGWPLIHILGGAS